MNLTYRDDLLKMYTASDLDGMSFMRYKSGRVSFDLPLSKTVLDLDAACVEQKVLGFMELLDPGYYGVVTRNGPEGNPTPPK